MGPLVFSLAMGVILVEHMWVSAQEVDHNINLESVFGGDDNAYQQYRLLNSVVKRQTKGSCSCTCETKPIIRYTDDDSKHSEQHRSSGSGDQKASMLSLRTGAAGSNLSQNSQFSGHGSQKIKPDIQNEHPVKAESDLPEVESRIVGGVRPDQNADQENEWRDYDQQNSDNRVSDSGWGHGSRFPWLHLPNVMCFRSACTSDADCCRKFNLCDRSAAVCVDCWYGSTCTSEAECCEKYPYCEIQESSRSGQTTGRCVGAL